MPEFTSTVRGTGKAEPLQLTGAALRIARRYTDPTISPLGEDSFICRPSRAWDAEAAGTIDIIDLLHLDMPVGWSAEACATLEQDIMAASGIPARLKPVSEDDVPEWLWRHEPDPEQLASLSPDHRALRESSAGQPIDRLAGHLTYWGWKGGYFDREEDARAFHDELCWMLHQQIVAPDINAWRAIGLGWAYGTSAAQASAAQAAGARTNDARAVDFTTGAIAAATTLHTLISSDASDRPHATNRWDVVSTLGSAPTRTRTPVPARAHLNLMPFLGGPGDTHFDSDLLRHTVRLWTIALDIDALTRAFGTDDEAEFCWNARPISLSLTNVAASVMALGMAYDSSATRDQIAKLAAHIETLMTATSAELAQELGACPARAAATDNAEHGYRNSVTVDICEDLPVATLLDAESVGIAPVGALVLHRATGSGGFERAPSKAFLAGLGALGYEKERRDAILIYTLGAGSLAESPSVNHRDLRRRGFPHAAIQAIEDVLDTTLDIRFAVTPWILGRDIWQMLGLDPAVFGDSTFDTLAALGFSEAEIDAANIHVCGAQTVIGAPEFNPLSAPVFDAATPAGGSNATVTGEGRIRMAASIAATASTVEVTIPSLAIDNAERTRLIELARHLGLDVVYFEAATLPPENTDTQPNLDTDRQNQTAPVCESFAQPRPGAGAKVASVTPCMDALTEQRQV